MTTSYGLTDSEIRLIILSTHYNALKKGIRVSQGKIPRLENIEPPQLNWNFIWLIEHKFLIGTIEEVTIGSIPFVNRISIEGEDKWKTLIQNASRKS